MAVPPYFKLSYSIKHGTNLTVGLARDRMGGRPKALDESQVKVAIALAAAGELTINQICEQVGCSRSTYYRQVAPRLVFDIE